MAPSRTGLKLPTRFLGSRRGSYKVVPPDEGAAPATTDGVAQSLMSCLEAVWSHRRRSRDRKYALAVAAIQEALETLEAQRVVAQEKLDVCSAAAIKAYREKDGAACKRALRRQKRLKLVVRGLEDYAFDLERKIDMLTELRTNRDVLDVVKNVGLAVSNVEVDGTLREAESATETLDVASDALTELTQFMRDSASRGVEDDDDALLLELAETLDDPPDDPVGEALTQSLPVAPHGNFDSVQLVADVDALLAEG